jgi:hypothetical protein
MCPECNGLGWTGRHSCERCRICSGKEPGWLDYDTETVLKLVEEARIKIKCSLCRPCEGTGRRDVT